MSKIIKIKKGLDIKLVGEAKEIISTLPLSDTYALNLSDFHNITPKLLVKEGTDIKAGEPVFYSKNNEEILFTSPVSGVISEILRGKRRKVLSIKITADKGQKHKDFGEIDINSIDGSDVKKHLLNSGCWAFIKQRPYDVIANPNKEPKAIFVSAYNSTPLSPNYNYILKDKQKELQTALTALTKLTKGKVHYSVGINDNPQINIEGVEIHRVSGPHPIGNVSTQIANIDPINKGETVWIVTPQDLIIIGELFLTGKFNPKRKVALTGAKFNNPQYVEIILGAKISDIVKNNLNYDNTRIISGNVLTGTQKTKNDYLGFYDNQITAISEGNDYEFFGWNKPIFNKISISRAFTFSWLNKKKKYDLNTNTNGEKRSFVLTGNYEEVFPLDIYPMQLLKACLYEDLDEMEGLGAYEIAPEDFALTEFICVSKQPHQKIIREGLDLMMKELE